MITSPGSTRETSLKSGSTSYSESTEVLNIAYLFGCKLVCDLVIRAVYFCLLIYATTINVCIFFDQPTRLATLI